MIAVLVVAGVIAYALWDEGEYFGAFVSAGIGLAVFNGCEGCSKEPAPPPSFPQNNRTLSMTCPECARPLSFYLEFQGNNAPCTYDDCKKLILYITPERQNEIKQKEEAEVFDEEFKEFTSSEGSKINDAIKDLTILEDSLNQRINKLGIIIRRTGRDPDQDTDLTNWKQSLSEIKNSKLELAEKLKDAFISFQKFKLSPSKSEREEYKNAIEEGSINANEILNRYEELKNEISGEKKN